MFTDLIDIASLFEVADVANGINSLGSPKFFNFNVSAKISTYLYVIVAGPYGYFESNVEGMPPMRIYARKSLMGEVKHEEMFLAT